MENKFYIVPQVVLDMLQENFKHSHFKSVEENKINKGKSEVIDLLKDQVVAVEEADVDEITQKSPWRSVGEILKSNVFTIPNELHVTIDHSSETCRILFDFLKQENYSGNFDRLMEEAVFKINLEEKTAKSLADTKEPTYTVDQFKVVHKLFG